MTSKQLLKPAELFSPKRTFPMEQDDPGVAWEDIPKLAEPITQAAKEERYRASLVALAKGLKKSNSPFAQAMLAKLRRKYKNDTKNA